VTDRSRDKAALGDFILALASSRRSAASPAAAAADHAFAEALARASGWFDEICRCRPEIWQIGGWRALGRRCARPFGRVYASRVGSQRLVFPPFGADKPEWSGIASRIRI
jgi:hypothetical protein